MSINEAERQRRKALVYAHMTAENDHDMDGVMETFADDTEMIFNGLSVRDHKTIHHLHSQFAFTADQSAITGTRLVADREDGLGPTTDHHQRSAGYRSALRLDR